MLPMFNLQLKDKSNFIIYLGVAQLSGAVGSLDHELEGLYLSEISLSSKGASILANSFKSNKHISSNLTVLNVSGNSFKADGTQVKVS